MKKNNKCSFFLNVCEYLLIRVFILFFILTAFTASIFNISIDWLIALACLSAYITQDPRIFEKLPTIVFLNFFYKFILVDLSPS